MKNFKPVGEGRDAAYYITADQKDDFFAFIRKKLAENNNSKKGIVTKTFLDGEEQMIRNKGTTEKPVFNFTNKGKTDASMQVREDAIEYATPESKKAAAKWKKENITDWNRGRKNKKGLWIQKPTNPTGKPLKDTDPLFRRWEHKVKVKDPFWKAQGLDLPYKSGDIENLTWTNPAQWKLKDAGEMTYGSKYIFDIDQYTGDVEYTPRKGFDPHTSVFKKFTGVIDETSKLIPTPVKRAAIVGGGLLPGALGTGLSAAEVYERNKVYQESGNLLDGIQLGLANASLFTGWSGIGEIIATPADLLNLGLDAARFGTKPTDTSSRQRYRHGNR